MSMIRNCKQLQLLQLPHKLSGWICTGLWISPTCMGQSVAAAVRHPEASQDSTTVSTVKS